MRNITGDIISSDKWNHPASIIFSGSSGTGKTSLALKLIENQHFNERIENVFYFGPSGNMAKELDWHNILEDVSVTYTEGIPSERFFASIPPKSLVVVDDQYEESIGAYQIAKAFKVDRRHSNFSIILITQSFFERGKYAKVIRNNCEVFALFRNYG